MPRPVKTGPDETLYRVKMIEPTSELGPSDQPATGGTPSAEAVEFAAEYAERIHRFAAMVTGNDQDSADLAQEAVWKALRGLRRRDPSKGTLEAWVWRIVVNTARDAGRLKKRRLAIRERWLHDQILTSETRSIETDVLERMRDEDLLSTVRRLPERARTMIALRFGAELSTGEIAYQLGMKPAAVSMAIKRALARLRADLEVHP